MDFSEKKLAITIGDPSGVGAEIIRKWVEENPDVARKTEVIAHAKFLETLPDTVSKRAVGSPTFEAVAGEPCAEGARVAFESLEAAAKGCADGLYRAVATAPISTFEMRQVGVDFAGQTEFCASRWGGTPVMAFAGEKLLLALATWHEPMRDVPDSLDAEKISRAVGAACSLARKVRGIEHPRIAVCGLNPHAGEGGILGVEEIRVINPALDRLRSEKYPNLSVALPPDTVFERALKGEFDCIVSMYHDQGLAPLKALEFDKAVNVSMNLKWVRTSPDHGTGFSIAGKSIASASSFGAAVELAFKLSEK